MLRNVIKSLIGPTLMNARFLFGAPLAYRPGHFYSPICDPAELEKRYRDPRARTVQDDLPGIDLAHEGQIRLWESWKLILPQARALVSDGRGRYQAPSSSFDVGDAIVYACMLRHLQPARLVEVGSGSSSALALDVFDQLLSCRPRTTFIEPHPDLVRSLMNARDKEEVEIMEAAVQDVSLDLFAGLQENDILFIDSTHVVKTGSDVVHEVFEVLPQIRSGVFVHFHDVFYPFEYPKEWVLAKNYSWNELYLLRAFLMGNQEWEIVFFNDYFARREIARVQRDAPEMLRNPGGGLWLRRR